MASRMSLPEPYYTDDLATLYHADAWSIVPQLEPASVDVIFTDPPYGIGLAYGATDSSRARTHLGQNTKAPAADDDRPSLQLWAKLRRLLTDKGTLHFTAGIRELPEWLRVLKSAGFHYRHTSVYWNERRTRKLADGGASIRDSTHSLGGDWEPWLHFTAKPEGRLLTTRRMPSDIFRHSAARTSKHPAERDLSAWRAMFELFVKPGMTVLDPFTGTGTTLVCGKELGAHVIGIEREQHWAEFARNRISQTTLFEQTALPEPAPKPEQIELPDPDNPPPYDPATAEITY